MAFTAEELALLYDRLQAERKRTKKKLDISFVRGYNETMSRVEMLAKALNGVVVEDQGYRGIIHVPAKNEFVRYHSANGVHVVQRTPKVWRVVRPVFSPDEVRPFLEESGLLPKIEPIVKPLEQLAGCVHGEVVMTFQTGGGVVKSANGIHYRFSNITGLDIVDFVVSKWRSVKHLATRAETLKAIMESKLHELVYHHEAAVAAREDERNG